MLQRFQTCLEFTYAQEGGWSDDPADPGGATNRGITLRTLSDYLGRQATADELQAMSATLSDAIYREAFWNPVRGDELPGGIDLMVFDMAVNAGPEQSIILLQTAIGVAPDGDLGPVTLRMARLIPVGSAISVLAVHQSEYYRALAGFPKFGDGWLARVERRRRAAFGGIQSGAGVAVVGSADPVGDAITERLNEAEAAIGG